MHAPLYPPARPQSIGEVIDTAFRIFKVSLLRCLPLSVLATIAGQLQNVYLIATGQNLHEAHYTNPVWIALYVVGLWLGFTFINAIVMVQAALAAGASSSSRVAARAGFRKVPATIAMLAVMGIALALCFLPLLAVPVNYRYAAAAVLCVPATYVGIMFMCCWPALLLGGKGIVGSLRYSARLVSGNWWRTATIVTIGPIMILVLSATAGMIVGVIAALGAAHDLAVTTAVSAVMVVASGAIYAPFLSAMTLALYGDLQARKDGIDLERRIASSHAG